MTYIAVSVEKRPRTGTYLVSTGPDTGYGIHLGEFDDLDPALELAEEQGDDIYYGPTVEEER